MATPSQLISRLLGSPQIPLSGNMGLLHRIRLNLERNALQGSTDVMSLLAKELATPKGKQALLAAIAAGGALGGGSLAWTLSKNSPQGPSRLANALERALFEGDPGTDNNTELEAAAAPRAAANEEMPWGQYGL